MNVAIILAGGTGTRVGADIPKQFVEIQGKTILAYTLEVFEKNENIDAIEIVCHKDWVEEVKSICDKYKISKYRWLCVGGTSFQSSTMNGIYNLKGKISNDDIVVISFGVAPLTPQADINDSIRVCKLHGNAIAAKDIDLCTCIKDDDYSSSKNIIRETLKGFANPWTFKFGELCEVYDEIQERGLLDKMEPHTTSLYFELGKKLWFSQCTSPQVKITQKSDLDVFEGILLLKTQQNKNKDVKYADK